MTVQQRIRDVLARMAQVSEAPGASVVTFDPNSHHETRVPSGVRTTAPIATLDTEAPRTLLDTWVQTFHDHADADDLELACLVEVAEVELAAYQHGLPASLVGEHEDPTQATERRCLTFYVGMAPDRAAMIEARVYGGSVGSLTKWMERLRIRNDRDPRTGSPRPAGEGRLRRVSELRAQGMGAKRIAQELGCHHSTVQRDLKQLESKKMAA